jgi:hypothetical protein
VYFVVKKIFFNNPGHFAAGGQKKKWLKKSVGPKTGEKANQLHTT